MFVKVTADGRVTLEERDNFRAFKVVVEGSPGRIDYARRALAGLADVSDKDTAWVFEAALRKRAEVAPDDAWQKSCGMMIEKAKPHGWIDEAARRSRRTSSGRSRHEPRTPLSSSAKADDPVITEASVLVPTLRPATLRVYWMPRLRGA